MIRVPIANEQTTLPVDEDRLARAARMILEEASIREAEVSVAVVDDRAMHAMNRRYLDHDYPTDVLSFLLEQSPEGLFGQVVVNADMARAEAERFGWPAADELLLYVIHGTLHLVGRDDAAEAERAEMRVRESAWLARFGLEPHWSETPKSNSTERGGTRDP
ncbi:MAG: rRNA maturation RNase YbeY [Planctomycetia bacterium]|jgi:probable rRNA maturation factor|nr:rRNA maturation RNase YbeY [Planctomycetia bacterium]